jgi:hypothetical protein
MVHVARGNIRISMQRPVLTHKRNLSATKLGKRMSSALCTQCHPAQFLKDVECARAPSKKTTEPGPKCHAPSTKIIDDPHSQMNPPGGKNDHPLSRIQIAVPRRRWPRLPQLDAKVA